MAEPELLEQWLSEVPKVRAMRRRGGWAMVSCDLFLFCWGGGWWEYVGVMVKHREPARDQHTELVVLQV